MKQRRTFTLEKNDLRALEPLLKENNNNFSKAMRDLIKYYNYREKKAYEELESPERPLTPKEIMDNRKELRDIMVERNLGWLNPPDYMVWALQTLDGFVPPLGIFRNTFDRIFPDLFGIEEVTIKVLADYVNTLYRLTGPQSTQLISYDDPENPTAVKMHYEMKMPGDVIQFAKIGSYMVAHRPLLLKPVNITKAQTFVDIEYTPAASEEEAYNALVEHFGNKHRLFDEILKASDLWLERFNVTDHFTTTPSTIELEILLKILKGDSPCQDIASICEKMLGTSLSEAPLEEVISALEKLGRTAGIIKNTELDDSEIKVYLSFSDRAVQELIARCLAEIISQTGREYKVEKNFSNWFILKPISHA